MALTWGELKTRIATRSHKDLSRTEEDADVGRWAKAGIELVESEDSWSWLYKDFTISLVANTYAYDWPSAMEKFDSNTLRYGGSNTYLAYARNAENIDRYLSPSWRDSSGSQGTPKYFTDFGRKFWIAQKPSSDFVSSNPTLYLYGYTTDLASVEDSPSSSTTLLIPYRAANAYVEAALMVGLQQEDDPDWRTYQQVFDANIQRLRGFDVSVASTDEVLLPEWSPFQEF
jgi:hypothetical protein